MGAFVFQRWRPQLIIGPDCLDSGPSVFELLLERHLDSNLGQQFGAIGVFTHFFDGKFVDHVRKKHVAAEVGYLPNSKWVKENFRILKTSGVNYDNQLEHNYDLSANYE